jgi:hypothetical protein
LIETPLDLKASHYFKRIKSLTFVYTFLLLINDYKI